MGVLCALILPAVPFRGHSGEGELASPFGVVLLVIVFVRLAIAWILVFPAPV